MGNYINYAFKESIKFDIGKKFFFIGVFFLPSALPISAIFLLISLFISFKECNSISLKDKWNYPLLLSIGIIIFSTLNISLINKPLVLLEYPISNIWMNLFNWLPIFFFYWGFQNYLKTNNQRLIFAKCLLSGSAPVIVSMILQKFFHFYGPFKTFYGLIVWFQKPLLNNIGVAGLFSNPNYAAIWLTLTLPFAILLLKKSNFPSVKNTLLLTFCLLIIYMILLTGSRNGMLGIIIAGILLYGFKRIFMIIIPIFSLISFEIFFRSIIHKGESFYNKLSFSHLFEKITTIEFSNVPRLEIWKSALVRIQERPFLGWGASTFSFLHERHNEDLIQPKIIVVASHSHNIFLEIAHNFGIPLSIILVSTIMLILLKTWRYIFFINNLNDEFLLKKAWFASSLIVFINHLSDLTYYDGKISILISLLFAGLKCIYDEKQKSIL